MRLHVAPQRTLEIAPAVLALMRAHAQTEAESLEAGGLLLGWLSDDCRTLTIDALTEPRPGDMRGRRAFEMSDPGHGQAAQRAWEASGSQVAVWGDWHTHAEPDPAPSPLDLETWREIAGGRMGYEGDCLFFAIVGTERVRVWEVTRDGAVRALVSQTDTIPAPPPTEPIEEPPPPVQRVPSLVDWPEERVTRPDVPHPRRHDPENTAAPAAESEDP